MPAGVFSEPRVAWVGTTSGDQVVTVLDTIERGCRPTNDRPARPSPRAPAEATDDSAIVTTVARAECNGQLALVVRARIPIETLP